MLIYIYGSDTFRSRDYLRQTIDRFKRERDPQGLNVLRFDGQKEEAGKIINAMVSTPFLAPKRMTVIENILSRKDADTLETFTELIEKKKLPEDNVVVFWQGEDAGKSKAVKDLETILKKEKWAREFKPMEKSKIPAWIKEEVENRGAKINNSAVNYLADHTGDDLWHLNSLIDQLAAYTKEEIQLSDAQLFLDEKVDDSIFNLVDSIVGGNRKLAFKLLEGQRKQGQEDGLIYTMILRQFRILIAMRDLYNREDGITSAEMAQILGVHPFVVKKGLALMKKFSLDKLKKIFGELVQIDFKTKTGAAPQSLLIDLFVGKI